MSMQKQIAYYVPARQALEIRRIQYTSFIMPAGNIMAFSDHNQNDCMSTL